MNNEQKAKEIAKKYQTPCHGMGDCEFEAYQSALEAMEWKEQILIDKACKWLRKNIESDKYLSPDEESYRMGCGVDYLETNMFIEDFKNYMKGGEE